MIDHVPYLSKVSDVVVIEGVEALQRLVASNIQVFLQQINRALAVVL